MSAWSKWLRTFVREPAERLPWWFIGLLYAIVVYGISKWKVIAWLGMIAGLAAIADFFVLRSRLLWAFTFPWWRKRELLDLILTRSVEEAERVVLGNLHRYFHLDEWPSDSYREMEPWKEYLESLHPTQRKLFERYYAILWPTDGFYIWCIGPMDFMPTGRRWMFLGRDLITECGKPEVYIGGRWRRMRKYPSIYHFLMLLIVYSKIREGSRKERQ